MSYKWIGAVFIIVSCGGFGFRIAAGCARQQRLLRQLLQALQGMEAELQYRLTPLPELCRQTGKETGGPLGRVFGELAGELDRQCAPDAASCMVFALSRAGDLPEALRRLLLRLGQILGRFDLPGQIQGLQAVQADCRQCLASLDRDREERMRSYRTLGLCAGTALVVLLV